MQIETKFNLLERVIISEIETKATVLRMQVDSIGFLYEVCYWLDGELKYAWIYEEQLTKCK